MEEYDVAFSLLSSDEPLARSIQDNLPVGLRSFLYSTSQRELLADGNGIIAFPDVFRKTRICVILYRAEWGETPWTRLERRTIEDRFLDDGSAFLVLVRLDDADPPSWFPRGDLWVSYDEEGPKATAEYIAARVQHSQSRAVGTRITARTLDRRPMPVARYQRRGPHSLEQFTPVEPMICDGCTAAVQFRPLIRIGMPADEQWPATQEQFCPRCARDRQIGVSVPAGMTEEVVFAPQNPPFIVYLRHVLSRVLPALSSDTLLRSLGVVKVGAAHSHHRITLMVSRAGEHDCRIEFLVRDLDGARLWSEAAVFDHMRTEIAKALNRSST